MLVRFYVLPVMSAVLLVTALLPTTALLAMLRPIGLRSAQLALAIVLWSPIYGLSRAATTLAISAYRLTNAMAATPITIACTMALLSVSAWMATTTMALTQPVQHAPSTV